MNLKIEFINVASAFVKPNVRGRLGLGLGLGLGKQRRAPCTGQGLENEDVDDDGALITRETQGKRVLYRRGDRRPYAVRDPRPTLRDPRPTCARRAPNMREA